MSVSALVILLIWIVMVCFRGRPGRLVWSTAGHRVSAGASPKLSCRGSDRRGADRGPVASPHLTGAPAVNLAQLAITTQA